MSKNYKNGSIFRILKFNKKYSNLLVLGIIATIIVCFNRIYVVKLLGKLVDSALKNGINDAMSIFTILVVSILSLAGFSGFKNYIVGKYTQKSMYKLRNHTLSIINHISIEELGFSNVGSLITRMNNCLSKTENLFENIIPDSLYKILVGVFALIIGLKLNWKLTMALVTVSVICCILDVKLTKSIEGKEMQLQKSKEKMGELNNDVIIGNIEVKSFSLYQRLERLFKTLLDIVLKKQFEIAKLSAWHEILIDSISMVMQIGVVLYGLYFVSKNEMTFGELIIFQQLSDLIQLLIHINFLELWKSIVGVKLLFEIWDAEGNNIDGIVEKGDEKSAIIDLENVYFKYSQDENVILKDISFRVHKGESIAIVGTSGSGKSTIAKLICGFNKPLSGKISYKGYEYDDWNLKKLRKGISIVEQNAYLFPVSIYDNIASGKYGYIDENNSDLKKSVEKAAEQAGLTEFIESLEDGYQGIVGENGDTMSGGQNQRITIARAFIKDSELLVLDEPTSALDVEIEQKIQKSIEELMKNRTTIIIAHRLSTIKNVQRILVLHEGEIVEQGTHSELINKKGRYFNLYNMQLTQQKGGQ